MRPLYTAALAFGASALLLHAADPQPPLATVPDLDLKRYQGRWYEIARTPNRFEKKCAGDVTATYTLRPDGKIRVLNECRKQNGTLDRADGTAKPAHKSGPASRLKVTFFWPFYGDYWVLALEPQYQWVIVGEPGRKYLWILSRNAQMPGAQYEELRQRVSAFGYDPARLQRTAQSAR